MTNLKTTKRALFSSVIALLVCFTMLLGTTFAWFTDSVTSNGNIIQTGTLEIGMYWAEGDEDPASVTWTDASTGAIFNNTKWEPGYVEAKHIKIANEGTLALKYKLLIVPNGEVEALADVIDVYYIEGATQLTRDMLATATPVGTLRDLINDTDGAAHGALLPVGETATDAYERVGEVTATIAFKMQETAGNEYQGKKIGTDFSIQLFATQYTYEGDSFDNQYDKDAPLPVFVKNVEELISALEDATPGAVIDATDVTLEIATNSGFEIPAGVTIKGATIEGEYRGTNNILLAEGKESVVFENCTFGDTSRVFEITGTDNGPDTVIYNNCVFKGQVVTNFENNPDGVAKFNTCTFTTTSNAYAHQDYVWVKGGNQTFTNCTFDYTGVTQTQSGLIKLGCLNIYSGDSYTTTVNLVNCTFINCGEYKYGTNSTLNKQ